MELLTAAETIIAVLLGFASIAGYIINRFRKKGPEKSLDGLSSIASRFVYLFQTHGVHRNQIPRFFGHDLTLADVSDDTSLLPKLTDKILDDACSLFAVRREWLDGAEPEIYPSHHFYKHPELFLEFIQGINSTNPDADLYGVVVAPIEKNMHAPALLLLQETIGYVGDKAISRYHLCDGWSYSYWKSRAYLTACAAMVCKHGCHIRGYHAPKREIEQLATGETLMGWDGEGFSELGHKSWYPEDMALRPEVYLDGVDPEQNNFGIRAALGHWLMLDMQGYMDTGLSGEHRQAFQDALDRLSSN
ncbi:MAG: hypothetical protein OEZ16_09655 [Chromatiales bacterium]|nr:hypothetical protein [Chromatiales bacterium]